MSAISELILLLNKQHQEQMAVLRDEHREQNNQHGRGYCFSKIDLANAYNQICLSPDSQKKLALSTHKGVLLQKRLSFGIKSAPGYFQEIMEQLTQNLRGVAVYFDDILVSGDNAKDHLMNLRALFKRLEEKGLRCNREKCVFAQVSKVEELQKGPKLMPY